MKEAESKMLGFWIYLMTDLVIFAVLFASFLVLRNATFGGITAQEIVKLPAVLAETLLLLTSSFTCSLAILAIHRRKRKGTIFWFLVTFLLGASFLGIEIAEFRELIRGNHAWNQSALLSSFFTLVGTHGLHISMGLLWIAIVVVEFCLRGLTEHGASRAFRLASFWHFLDVVWVALFTVVYGIQRGI